MERETTCFHIFPSLKLPNSTEKIGQVVLKSKDLIQSEEQRSQEFLGYAFSLFKDPFGADLKEGVYIVDEEPSTVEDAWLLLRFAAYIPREQYEIYFSKHNSDLVNWFEFYASQHSSEKTKKLEIFSASKNGIEIWGVFDDIKFFPFIQQLHLSDQYLLVSEAGLNVSKRLADLFLYRSEFDYETIKLAERLRKAIYWYDKSYEQGASEQSHIKSSLWDLEGQILYMAVAFETLFQPPKTDIQKYLETSLKVLFPDNDFVPKWLNQFYAVRSSIAHGSSVETKELSFRPDKAEHHSLIYWSRRIFRVCVEAIVSQWETARNSGLLKLMTPNRIRLNRILGKLNNNTEESLLKTIPEDIRTDIHDLHASWVDIPDESYLEQTHNIGKILCTIAVKSPHLGNDLLREVCHELLSLPQDWYKSVEYRTQASDCYTDILDFFGDKANISDPLIQLSTENKLEQTIYHWSKFAYAHIWIIDI